MSNLKHLREIYKKYSNLVNKEIEMTWQIIGRYAYETEQDKLNYESFGRFVANLIEKEQMK